MNNKRCNDCGELVYYNGRVVDDYNIDVEDNIICGECGISSHCFCDDCGEYVRTSDCVVVDYKDDIEGVLYESTDVVCSDCLKS